MQPWVPERGTLLRTKLSESLFLCSVGVTDTHCVSTVIDSQTKRMLLKCNVELPQWKPRA